MPRVTPWSASGTCLARVPQRTAHWLRRLEIIVGDHLDDIDAVEIRKYSRGELGPPADAKTMLHTFSLHRRSHRIRRRLHSPKRSMMIRTRRYS